MEEDEEPQIDKTFYERLKASYFTNQYPCLYCNKKFKSRGSLNRHIMIHTKMYTIKCHICFKGFPDNWKLKRHLTNVHRILNPIIPPRYKKIELNEVINLNE